VSHPRTWGIDEGYYDASSVWRDAPPETLKALLEAMGAKGAPPPSGAIVLRAGAPYRHPRPFSLHLEDGGEESSDVRLPRDVPLGYHRLVDDEGETPLIVSPGLCHLPEGLRGWGWAVQSYALRSGSSWGLGDLADLRRFGGWARDLGAAFALVNPLHALPPGAASPYYPSSRCFRDPIHLRPDELPGADEEVAHLASRARALNERHPIDRDAARALKEQAFAIAFRNFTGAPAFDRYRQEGSESLRRFATYVALSRRHGSDWHDWPEELRHPRRGAVREFAAAHQDEIVREEWLQWQISEQLRRADAEIDVVHDLAVGIDPGGADAWVWQDVITPGVTVGAPPDDFNLEGQGWGLAAWDPHRLRASGYGAFIDTVRSALSAGGGLRYDHVMGLFRLFWIPPGAGPAEGTYVRYPASDLLDILALESHRAEAFVVGEDLGTVEEGVREELARRKIMTYRLLWFEEGEPEDMPEDALATVTNHDLPTIAGVWSGTDLEDQRRAGVAPNEAGDARLRDSLTSWGGGEDAPVEDVVDAAYRLLARTPARLKTALLEDALGAPERVNLPGTSDAQRPNWSIPLPLPLEEIETHPGPGRIAEILERRVH
jgi:4-alpha-glucanotransferase